MFRKESGYEDFTNHRATLLNAAGNGVKLGLVVVVVIERPAFQLLVSE